MKKDKTLYYKKYYKEHTEQVLASNKKYRREHPEKIKAARQRYEHSEKGRTTLRKNYLKYRFGISLDVYNELFNKQNGCCAVCGKHQSELKCSLRVDHNHITGRIRRLLCTNCNIGLGLFRADEGIKILQQALNYVLDV